MGRRALGTIARKRRRIEDLGTIGFLLIGVLFVMCETELARRVVVGLALLYGLVLTILVFRVSRCPRCGSFLQLTICGGRITIPGFFQSTCSECGWDESSEPSPTAEDDPEEKSVR